jgi:2'-5' RNA ligase
VSVRLFVALDLPAPAREALAAFRDAAADPEVWRRLPESSFHVTLAFLGHRPDEDVERVVSALGALSLPAELPLRLGPALLLPPRRARVLTVELSGEVGPVQATVSDALEAIGVFTPERRPFRAHVTVARLRPGARAPRAVEGAPEPVAFGGGPIVLYRSRLGRGGASYEPLFTTVGPR